MAKCMLISAIVVLAAIIKEGSSLKCWRCSSDLSTAAFCADPFDPTLIQDDKQRKWAFVDCNVPPVPYTPNAPPQKAVCKKVKQILNNREIVSRSCVFEDFNTPANQCSTDSLVAYAKTEYCETCSTDGCNSAGSFAPVAFLIVVSATIAKLLPFLINFSII